MRKIALCAAALLVALLAGAAFAADLVIGRATEQSSLDPLFARSGTNYSTSGQIFERLVMNDANNQLHPALAVSWRVEPTTWEIKLRDKVKFHDGSDFTADDVIFSFERARNVPNSPASFAGLGRKHRQHARARPSHGAAQDVAAGAHADRAGRPCVHPVEEGG